MRPVFSVDGVLVMIRSERPQVRGAHDDRKAGLVRPAGSAFADAPELKTTLVKAI